jgi:small-conductance mechanosensitive channel
VLSELFASLSILLDKPFQVGEFIIVGDMLGVVENIGLKTTRIRSLSGELLIFSNADLLSSRIRNYKTMQERRVVFTIGVEYNTPSQKLKKIPAIIRNAVETNEATRFDRCHFASYGDFSLNYETVYYVLSGDYNQYMDIQQKINLQIYEAFEQENIVFAFPTRTIHLKPAEEA